MLQLLKHTNRKISLVLIALFLTFRAVYIVQKPELFLAVLMCFILHIFSAFLLSGFLISAQLTLRTSAVSAIAFMAFSSLRPCFCSVYESLGLFIICFVLHILAKSIEKEQINTRLFQAALIVGFVFPVAPFSFQIVSALLLSSYLLILNLKSFRQILITISGSLTGILITCTAISAYSMFSSSTLNLNVSVLKREQFFSNELYILLFFVIFALVSYKTLIAKKSTISQRHLLFITIFNLTYALLWLLLDFSYIESLYGLIFPVSICSIFLESKAKSWKINSFLYGGLAILILAQVLDLMT